MTDEGRMDFSQSSQSSQQCGQFVSLFGGFGFDVPGVKVLPLLTFSWSLNASDGAGWSFCSFSLSTTRTELHGKGPLLLGSSFFIDVSRFAPRLRTVVRPAEGRATHMVSSRVEANNTGASSSGWTFFDPCPFKTQRLKSQSKTYQQNGLTHG